MVFSDPAFLFAFLPAALLGHWLLRGRSRNPYLILIGSVFYMWSGGSLILLLGTTVTIVYLVGRFIASRPQDRTARSVLALAIIATTGSLVWWKYAGFLSRQLTSVLEVVGVSWRHPVSIVLPIAISFYTFQCISYLVDVYQRRCAPARSLTDFAAYIFLFPHLIAGPIVRFADIEAELVAPPRNKWDDFANGSPRFFWGLAKKIIIADQVAVIANASFALPNDRVTFASAWIGALAFTIQIYFDFSGYSDMAIGLAKMFGFSFHENFNRPYAATSVTDFWRRWHISLSTWFRDYVYIPLGGNRRSSRRTYVNLLIVFTLTGFWHGANWTYLLWGLFHGAWLIIERLTGWSAAPSNALGRRARRLITVVIVSVGWVLFRAVDVSQAWSFITAMARPMLQVPIAVRESLTTQRMFFAIIGLALVLVLGADSIGGRLTRARSIRVDAVRLATVAILGPVALMYALSSDFSPFLYFQF